MGAELQESLLKAIEKIDRPGTFCTSGRLPATFPGLEVAGVGSIALPLEANSAEAIKKKARQAPYGKGTLTLVDTDVRRVWEIDADQITLTNPEWLDVLRQAIETVQTDLGLEKQKLDAHLYKLLLYEPESFFLPHQDGEKLDRMVATLVIALPSAHTGGQLIVRHEGREQTVDFAPQSRFHAQFAAFYADCEHEIRPVKSGFRLALVYNLTLAASKRKIAAPTSGGHISAIAHILQQWKDDSPQTKAREEKSVPSKLAILLDHEYTEAGLTSDALKGVDRAKADALFEAARVAGCDASLALVTYWETGSAESSRGYRRRGYGRYGDEYDEEGDHEMGEVYDRSLTAKNFSDADGKPLAFGEIPLDESQIVSQVPLSEGEPDEEEFEGYTGNAGMTLERWYHRAAVMVWPIGSRFDVLCEAGMKSAIGGLELMVRQWTKAKKSEQPALREPGIEFARRIMANWPERPKGHYRWGKDEPAAEPLLPQLETLGDTSLIAAWISGVMARDVSINPGPTLGDVCKRFGWLTFQRELHDLFDKTANETIERNAAVLADCSLRKDKDPDRKNLCAELAKAMMSAVEKWSPGRSNRDYNSSLVNPVKLLPPLVQSFMISEQADLLDRLVTYVLAAPKEFDFTTAQIPALLSLETWLAKNIKHRCLPLRRWLTTIREELESRVAHPPQAPADWRRNSKISCKCGDCAELRKFLDDPAAEKGRFAMAEARRQHLQQIISQNKLDVKHETERRGSPHTLVCTKTRASYESALKAHHLDLDHFAKIHKLLGLHDGLT
ncbi:MAG TPA: 2OG-Fe(II) oxygenase [Tepidisphaeraceae bacterium]|jgi:hypothetical protein|nr:2OG-Fe(II) oxygenase [Tepidisphaeraceae bacterium]